MAWFRTSPIEEFVGSLEFAASCASDLSKRPEVWRWFVLSLHLALQGALVCAMKGFDTSGVLALSSPSARRTQEWLAAGAPRGASPNQQLASVRELLVRAENYLPANNRLPFSREQANDLLRLNEIRNNFAHLVADGWSLDLTGLPRISLNTIAAIEHLAVTAPTFWHQYEDDQLERVRRALGNLRIHLMSLNAAFVGSSP